MHWGTEAPCTEEVKVSISWDLDVLHFPALRLNYLNDGNLTEWEGITAIQVQFLNELLRRDTR
jgi:hypothetical protein